MLPEDFEREIIERLRPINPEKVILFGSYACGEPTDDSDIDLYVVTRDNFIPQSFKEKMDLKLKISKSLLDFRMKHPVDLIVHTMPMYRNFMQLGSSFALEIEQKGIRLL